MAASAPKPPKHTRNSVARHAVMTTAGCAFFFSVTVAVGCHGGVGGGCHGAGPPYVGSGSGPVGPVIASSYGWEEMVGGSNPRPASGSVTLAATSPPERATAPGVAERLR